MRDFGEWDKLPEDIVCAIPFYERLAHFLLNVYTIPTGVGNMGESLSGDTPKNYLGIAINRSSRQVEGGRPGRHEAVLLLSGREVHLGRRAVAAQAALQHEARGHGAS